ncbi:MAG TPA: hypothetical protein VKG23_19605 [Thermoanaerobaculia bacterium]|nr:hypothetical protein [Thermoanaerobaculia bacterium]
MNSGIFGARGRRGRLAGRAALLLFTISALLFVGIESRLAQRLPTRSPEELLTSFSDPVKVPPPEEKCLDDTCAVLAAAECLVEAPPATPLSELRTTPPHSGERHSSATLLRAPPLSL